MNAGLAAVMACVLVLAAGAVSAEPVATDPGDAAAAAETPPAAEPHAPVGELGGIFALEPDGPRARPRLSEKERTLLERPDRERFDDGPRIDLFGRPLIIGGQYTVRTRYEDGRLDKNGAKVDSVRLNQEAKLDVFYPWSEDLSAYVQGRFRNRILIWSSRENATDDWNAELAEAWLFAGNLLGSPVSLQVGRQRIFDEREWWWDQEFDAARLHVDLERLHIEASVADDFPSFSTDPNRDDPKNADLFLAFGRAMFEWAPNQEIGLHAIYQHDHSGPLPFGVHIDPDTEEDPSDADLTWVGVSALGRREFATWGELQYWLDGAYVWGDETFYDVSGPNASQTLSRILDNSVSGWGIDVGATWELPQRLRPSLTLSYARGSGSSNMAEETDTGFRQTGLQNNKWKWRGGVNTFKYYGEILDPELANLEIFTAAVGIRLLRNSSATLVFHHFQQVGATDFLRDAGISADPDGQHRNIGQEVDLIFGIEEWRHVQLEIIGGLFRAGSAFGPDFKARPAKDRVSSQEGDLSYLGIFQFRVNF